MKINEGLKQRDGTAPLLQTIIIPSGHSKWGYFIPDMSNWISPSCSNPHLYNECNQKCLVVGSSSHFFTAAVTALLTQEKDTRAKL